MNKLGILGGTFDPVHNAHLELAFCALKQENLDRVLFIPAGMPVRKLNTTETSALDRLAMLRIACNKKSGIEVSTIEIDRPDMSYTIDTLRELKQFYGQACQLFLILGEDTATDLHTWKDSKEISLLAKVLYAKRDEDNSRANLPDGFDCKELVMPKIDTSSSRIRKMLQAGKDVSDLLPTGVLSYIKEHDLYTQTSK